MRYDAIQPLVLQSLLNLYTPVALLFVFPVMDVLIASHLHFSAAPSCVFDPFSFFQPFFRLAFAATLQDRWVLLPFFSIPCLPLLVCY